jgi:hypothetical protein
MAEPKNIGEIFRDGRTPDRRSELYIRRECIVEEKSPDFIVDLCELLNQLCALLGSQFKAWEQDLIGFDNIDAISNDRIV